jgi:hypothetical protein
MIAAGSASATITVARFSQKGMLFIRISTSLFNPGAIAPGFVILLISLIGYQISFLTGRA